MQPLADTQNNKNKIATNLPSLSSKISVNVCKLKDGVNYTKERINDVITN